VILRAPTGGLEPLPRASISGAGKRWFPRVPPSTLEASRAWRGLPGTAGLRLRELVVRAEQRAGRRDVYVVTMRRAPTGGLERLPSASISTFRPDCGAWIILPCPM